VKTSLKNYFESSSFFTNRPFRDHIGICIIFISNSNEFWGFIIVPMKTLVHPRPKGEGEVSDAVSNNFINYFYLLFTSLV
jgi:hypothetical protein